MPSLAGVIVATAYMDSANPMVVVSGQVMKPF